MVNTKERDVTPRKSRHSQLADVTVNFNLSHVAACHYVITINHRATVASGACYDTSGVCRAHHEFSGQLRNWTVWYSYHLLPKAFSLFPEHPVCSYKQCLEHIVSSQKLSILCRHRDWAHCVVTDVEHNVFSHKLSTLCRHRSWAHCVVTDAEHSVSSEKLSTLRRHTSWAHCVVTEVEHIVSSQTLSTVCRHRSWAHCHRSWAQRVATQAEHLVTEVERSVSSQKLSTVCRHTVLLVAISKLYSLDMLYSK
jgi:hypothetical protein